MFAMLQSSGPQKEDKRKKGKKGKEDLHVKGGKQGARPQSGKGQGRPEARGAGAEGQRDTFMSERN